MDLFKKARSVRLRSHHDKYLLADDDQESVSQERNGTSKRAKWTVELLEDSGVIRLKSCYGKYLTASNIPFLFGVRGRKVLQSVPKRLDSSVEWEPIRDGVQVMFKTRYGQYLRANGGVPPWRNQITHDAPPRAGAGARVRVLWDVDIVEIRTMDEAPAPPPNSLRWPSTAEVVSGRHERRDSQETVSSSSSPPSLRAPPPPPGFDHWSDDEAAGSSQVHDNIFPGSSTKSEGRVIVYSVANDNGEVEGGDELSFTFKGNGVEELKQKLGEETGLDDIVVCSRNPLNGMLYPLRLHLPPNNANMRLVVVPSSEGCYTMHKISNGDCTRKPFDMKKRRTSSNGNFKYQNVYFSCV